MNLNLFEIHPGTFLTWFRLNERDLNRFLYIVTPETVSVPIEHDPFQGGVSDEMIEKFLAIILLTPQHTYQIVTRDPERVRVWFAERWQPTIVKDLEGNLYNQPGDTRESRVKGLAMEHLCGDLGNDDRFWRSDESAYSTHAVWPPTNLRIEVQI